MVAGVPGAWIAAIAAFLAVAMGSVALSLVWEWLQERRRKEQVVEQLERMSRGEVGNAPKSGSLLRAAGFGDSGALSQIAARFQYLQKIEVLIEQAALSWTLRTYLTLSGGFALALGLGTLIATGRLFIALIAAVIGGILPYLHARRKRTQRLAKFEEQFPEAVDLLGRAIRAGHPLSSGLKMVADEAPDPIGGEFRRVFEEQRFGLPFDDALLGLADRIPLVDIRIFASAVLIQREVGGNLAEILDKLSYVIRERFTIRRQLNVITAQGRLSGYILAGLPFGVAFMLFMINAEYVSQLWIQPMGRLMIGFALFWQFIGFLWIRRIINIEI